MAITYFKRYRMEIDLRGRRFDLVRPPAGYRLLPFHADLLDAHALVKYESFCDEIDSVVFSCFTDPLACQRLMVEICGREGFLPQATWLAQYLPPRDEQASGSVGTSESTATPGERKPRLISDVFLSR